MEYTEPTVITLQTFISKSLQTNRYPNAYKPVYGIVNGEYTSTLVYNLPRHFRFSEPTSARLIWVYPKPDNLSWILTDFVQPQPFNGGYKSILGSTAMLTYTTTKPWVPLVNDFIPDSGSIKVEAVNGGKVEFINFLTLQIELAPTRKTYDGA